MALKLSLNRTFMLHRERVFPFPMLLFLSEVISCSRAIVTSIAELQVRKSKIFCHVNELDKYRVCNMKEFELGVLFSFVRVEAN